MNVARQNSVDLKKIRRIHFVGIKGVAMTALAIYVKEMGISVSGSDISEVFPTDETLAKAGIRPSVGFDAGFLRESKPDMVVYTGAHGGYDNPQVAAAGEYGIPAVAHGKALGMFMGDHRQVSIAGSHGKTTTSAMIATILTNAGIDASYAIGCGEIFGLGLPGHWGKSNVFVVEADEYVTDPTHDPTPRFLWQNPEILVTTNIDFDHPDVFSSLHEVQDAFVGLQKQQVGEKVTIVNYDDQASHCLIKPNVNSVITYGMSPHADFRVSHIGCSEGRTFFTLYKSETQIGEFSLKVAGKHNALNAAAAALACSSVGVSWQNIRTGLMAFRGTKRRFEFLATINGVTYYDDYAHHPREIRATIDAVRQWHPRHRIVIVFQPHTYTRTQALLGEFAQCFTGSNLVLITDIYASSREHPTGNITARSLVEEASRFHSNILYAKDKKTVASMLTKLGISGDIVVFMGAGSIFNWAHELVRQFSQKDG